MSKFQVHQGMIDHIRDKVLASRFAVVYPTSDTENRQVYTWDYKVYENFEVARIEARNLDGIVVGL